MGSAASLPFHEQKENATSSDVLFMRRVLLRPYIDEESSDEDSSDSSLNWEDKETEKTNKEEDFHVQKDTIFKVLNEAITKLNKLPNLRDEHGNWMEDLRHCLCTLLNQMSEIRNMGQLAYGVIGNYRREAGLLISTTRTVNTLCNVVKEGWTFYNEHEQVKPNNDQFLVIELALDNLVSFSDSSSVVKCDIAKDENFLKTLIKILKKLFKSDILKGGEDQQETRWIKSSLIILCNVSQVDENMKKLQKLNSIDIISPYLDTQFRFVALTYLANIVKEDESAKMQGKDQAIETFKFLSHLLSDALKDKLHRCEDDCKIYWSAQECAQLIRVLARNERSKRMLTEVGCLPSLVELASVGTVDEQKEAVGAIWALAFDKDNQKMMLEDKNLSIVSMLQDLRKGLDAVVEAADGALWILTQGLNLNEAYKDVMKERNAHDAADVTKYSPGEADDYQKKGHVMISYNRNHRKIATWIKDQLEANGYLVWMDIGNMGGSTLQTMADAIESAHVFLFCCSQGYKNSSNCRQEAVYARNLGERVQRIPILVENGYKADGWLGFYVGDDYYYDFSGKYSREEKLLELLDKLKQCYQKIHGTTISELRKWTSKDIENWIKVSNLPRAEFEYLTGRDLAALVTMRKEAPDCFYGYIKTDLKIKSLSTIDLFIESLEDLTK